MEEDPDERRKRIRRLFDQLDNDQRGSLNASNVTKRLNDMAFKDINNHHPLGSTIMYGRELVKVCDKTKDGTITFQEFEEFVHQKESELYDLFKRIDTDRDDIIQLPELIKSFREAGHNR